MSAFLALALAAALAQTPAAEVVADVQIQGNLATSDAEVRRLAGVEIGAAVGASTVADIDTRLRATKRFERVEVLKRYASIADPTQITLVIIVDEGPVHVELTDDPKQPTRVVRNRGPRLLVLPMLDAEDGYGLSYGARLALPNPFGGNSRVSFPLTWGGEKRAGVEIDKTLAVGPFDRILGGASIDERTNPFYEEPDNRRRVWIRGEHAVTPQVRVSGTAGWQHVSFSGTRDTFAHAGVDVVVDTRLDPVLARNALYARAAIDRLSLASGGVTRTELDARGYIGLFRQNVLILRALREGADAPLPPYLKSLLGGITNLRGFRAGTVAGDTLVAGTAEVLMPLTSPLSVGKMGVSVFTDLGAAYDDGQALDGQAFHRGVGGSVWFSAAFVRLSVAVAHGAGASTRVHVGGGLSF